METSTINNLKGDHFKHWMKKNSCQKALENVTSRLERIDLGIPCQWTISLQIMAAKILAVKRWDKARKQACLLNLSTTTTMVSRRDELQEACWYKFLILVLLTSQAILNKNLHTLLQMRPTRFTKTSLSVFKEPPWPLATVSWDSAKILSFD